MILTPKFCGLAFVEVIQFGTIMVGLNSRAGFATNVTIYSNKIHHLDILYILCTYCLYRESFQNYVQAHAP